MSDRNSQLKPMYRPRAQRVIGGVCAAIAIRRGWSVTSMRILFFILGMVFFPIPEIVYLIARWVIPEEDDPR
jgi:phage shock protein PspC (stress-responsive transcriptional regulator)